MTGETIEYRTLDAAVMQITPQEILDRVELEDPRYDDPILIQKQLDKVQRAAGSATTFVHGRDKLQSPFVVIYQDKSSTTDTRALRSAILDRIAEDYDVAPFPELDGENHMIGDDQYVGGQMTHMIFSNSPKTFGGDGYIWRLGMRTKTPPDSNQDLEEVHQIGLMRTTETVEEAFK